MIEKKFTELDFDEASGTYFYILFLNNICQYVGQTGNIFERLGKHPEKQHFDKILYRKEINIQPKSLEANLIEADLIITYLPLNNKCLPPNDFKYIDLKVYCNGNGRYHLECPITINMAIHILNKENISPIYKNYYEKESLDKFLNSDNFHGKKLPLPIKRFIATGDIKGELYYHKYNIDNSLVYLNYAIINPAPPSKGFINIRIIK